MSKRKTAKKRKSGRTSVKKSPLQIKVMAANQLTGQIIGNLKNAQRSFLRIGALLTEVRDKKMYSDLKFADMEAYAEKRLHLGKTSLYKYLDVYDWVRKSHPEWLEKKVKGLIPDLSDIDDLIWIEEELKRTNLSSQTRAELEKLQKKALDGQLKQGEINPFRRRGHPGKDGIKGILSKLRFVRKRALELATFPAQVIEILDTAIGILKNDDASARF